MPDMRTSNPLVIFCARRNSQAAHRHCLVIMDPSDMKDELDSLLEASFTWATEDVLTDVYFLNESGEEVKETTDICAHIRCNINDPKQKKAHQNKFQSRLKKPETMDRLYSRNAEGRKEAGKRVHGKQI